MIKVGITGGIGSGKSTVCAIFKKLNIPVFDSDKIAKEQYLKPSVKEAVVKQLGEEVLNNDKVDMDILRKILFSDKAKLDAITNIIHPSLMEDYENFCKQHNTHYYCLFESAIIFERNLSYLFDRIITVVADKEERIKRVMARNNATREEVVERINLQLSDEYKIAKSNIIIRNNGEDLQSQIIQIHRDIVLP